MNSYSELREEVLPSLIVAKGSFASMGGAERDLLRIIPSLTKFFSVKVATLHKVPELEDLCQKLKIKLFAPKNNWSLPRNIFSTILDTGIASASNAWATCEGLIKEISDIDFMHIISGDGSLGLFKHIPEHTSCHLHLLEPHRGLHQDVLHRNIDGFPKRNLRLTKLLLSRARNRDLQLIKKFYLRKNSAISSNSNYSSSMAKDVYGIKTGVLWPCVDATEFPEVDTNDVENPYNGNDEYVVNIGKASWVKGTWETIKMISGTNLGVVHVGGGEQKDLKRLKEYADYLDVNLWIAPRLSSPELVSLMRNSRAIVSMAYGEAFGLTPIEAFAVGTPAIFVNEGGFRDTIKDGVSGKLLDRDDLTAWHVALQEASKQDNREKWTKEGRKRIAELDLSPENHARRIKEILI
ncbi:MAG: glycosyltransferase family 1 protein [Candidatus Poseidoniales archaeon]|nr:MAG: glycosyltransferase family 1 protein [Candidatus Poseidoniales archaeon]